MISCTSPLIFEQKLSEFGVTTSLYEYQQLGAGLKGYLFGRTTLFLLGTVYQSSHPLLLPKASFMTGFAPDLVLKLRTFFVTLMLSLGC